MNIFNSSGPFFKRFSNVSIDPMRDWFILLACAAIVFIGIVVWNVWTFSTIVQGGVIGSSVVSPSSVFNQSSFDAVRTVLSDRSAEEAKYRTGVYRYTDPSL
ncbi:MAG: hypothetical protein Q8P17_02460 [bacterium]|nr:hypothetical protein [bacterium]